MPPQSAATIPNTAKKAKKKHTTQCNPLDQHQCEDIQDETNPSHIWSRNPDAPQMEYQAHFTVHDADVPDVPSVKNIPPGLSFFQLAKKRSPHTDKKKKKTRACGEKKLIIGFYL